MSEFQVVTLLATLLGLTATVLNLVAFVREKDRSHTRTGLGFLLLLSLLLAVLFLPRYWPRGARNLVSRLPPSAAEAVQPWLDSGSESGVTIDSALPSVRGSFTIEIHRNLLGGIGALVSDFQFTNLSPQAVRVTAYQVRITSKSGGHPRAYDRVLHEPVGVSANGTAKAQVELDTEIRDQWLAREELHTGERGPIEISWECQDSGGRQFRFTSSNG